MIPLTCISHIFLNISLIAICLKKTINRILQTKLLRFMHRVSINYLFINYKHHIFNKPSQPFHYSEQIRLL